MALNGVSILICCKSKLNNKTVKRVCVILFLQVDKLLHSHDSLAWFCINMLRRDWKWSSVSTTRRCKHIFLLCWVQFVQKVPEIGTERFLRINWRNLPESLKVILRTPDQSWFKQLLKLVTNQTWLCLLIEGVFFDNLSQMEKIISVVISWNTPSYMKLSRHQSQKCRISCIALLNGRNNEKQFPKKRCRLKKEKKNTEIFVSPLLYARLLFLLHPWPELNASIV